MKLHSQSAGFFLQTLIEAMEGDSGCVREWNCLRLPGLVLGQPDDSLVFIEQALHDYDGALVEAAHGTVLIFFRGLQGAGQAQLVRQLQEALELPDLPEAHLIDLTQSWRPALHVFRRELEGLAERQKQRPGRVLREDLRAGAAYMSGVLEQSKFGRTYRSPMTVLLVEDDPVTCKLAGNLLKQEHVLVTAGNAYEAVVNYLLHAPEIVFLDINLPDDSGLGVLDQLIACDPDAYVVMFSGNDSIETIIEARNRGARGFIAKPFQRDRLKHFLYERQHLAGAG